MSTLLGSFIGTKKNILLLLILAVLLALFFIPAFLSKYSVYLLTVVLFTSLLATSLNISLGYGGMLPLHQTVFFGVGAYAAALLLNKSPLLPLLSFLSFLAAPLVSAGVALIIGAICVRLRGLYFGMMTLAIGQLVWAIVYRWYEFTGGDDGIHGIAVPDVLHSISAAYYISLIVVSACLLIIYIILNSPFGIALQAVRDNPQRCESIGINIHRHQLIAFVLSGFFSGVAGVLFVILERSVSPSLLFWSESAELLIMVLLGGMFTFMGPAFGATVIIVLEVFLGVITEYWLLVLGTVLVLIILFLPQGVIGFVQEKISAGTAVERKGADRFASG